MVRDTSPRLRVVTLLLAAITYVAVEVASDREGIPSLFGLIFGALLFIASMIVAARVGPPKHGQRLPRGLTLALGALLVGPLLIEPLLREWFQVGLPLELQLVHGLRNMGIALAAFAAWPICLRSAGVVALFNILFVSAMGDQKPIPYLLAFWAVVASLWLVLFHATQWQQASTIYGVSVVRRAGLQFPLRPLLVFGALALIAGGVAIVGPRRVQMVLGEWLPTSGGTGDYDPFSRGGVNDGDEETAGMNAQATGFVESDLFLDSPDPALYDAVSDMYGPPKSRQRQLERMMALGKADVRELPGRPPDSKRPSREFDTLRQGPKSPRRPEDQPARALFEIEGPTPLHLRVEVYGQYSAGVWQTAERRTWSKRFEVEEGSTWMRPIQRDPLSLYGPTVSHRIKIASLKGALIPTPPLLERFRVGRLNRPDFFAWEFDGVLRMDGRKSIPSGTIVSTDSFTLAGERLRHDDFALLGDWVNPDLREAPSEYQQWAERWAGDQPHGWPQVDAVIQRLRNEFVLDPQATAPDDCPDPVAHFFQTRRGPDYLFASAATLILRRLGYPSRLVLGYYAAPDSFDAASRHTPVRRTDLHFWTEVLLRDGRWLVVEPTPGYDVLRPAQPWWIVLRDAVVASAPMVALIGVLAVVLWWRRRDWLDWLRTARFRVSPGTTWRKQVLHCLWLIEQRGRWAGLSRTPQQTFTRWTDSLPDHARTDRDWNTLVSLGEWASYSDQSAPPIPSDEIQRVCRRVVHHWTIRRFQRVPTIANRPIPLRSSNSRTESSSEKCGA